MVDRQEAAGASYRHTPQAGSSSIAGFAGPGDSTAQLLNKVRDPGSLNLVAGAVYDQSSAHVTDRLDDFETVLGQGPPGRNQIHDPIRETQKRRQLHTSVKRDNLHRNSPPGKMLCRDARILRGNPDRGEFPVVLSCGHFRPGDCQSTLADSEIQGLKDVRLGLQQNISSDNAEVCHSILHIGWNINRFQQEELEAVTGVFNH